MWWSFTWVLRVRVSTEHEKNKTLDVIRNRYAGGIDLVRAFGTLQSLLVFSGNDISQYKI
jgi:hypothetical protein